MYDVWWWSFFSTHLDEHLSCVVGVGDTSFVKCSIETETHISHKLINSVSGHFGEFYFVCLIVLHLLAENLCLSWSIQPLLWKLYLRTEGILLNRSIYSLLLYLPLFALVLADLYLFLQLFSFHRLSLFHLRLVILDDFLLLLLFAFFLLFLCLGKLLLLLLFELFDLLCSFSEVFKVETTDCFSLLLLLLLLLLHLSNLLLLFLLSLVVIRP